MPEVYVGIGSNLRPEANLRLAIRELTARFGAPTCSPVYRNAAVGFVGDDFLNMVASFRSNRGPEAIVTEIEQIHLLAGRARGCERMVSRTLDIDLLLYGDRVQTSPPLPRDDVLDYLFVLRPLADLAPQLRHPVSGRRMAEHLAEHSEAEHALELVPFDFQQG
jgi:2-amino-4-hydroxy-6-hydroxymethyldihydropteridine diphosphokinase